MLNVIKIFDEAPPALFVPLQRRTIGGDVLDALRKTMIAGSFISGEHIEGGRRLFPKAKR